MNRIAEILLDWYAREGRDLPWRRTRDPYRIWLSEVILQQTRVAQGMEYYLRFTERFPDVASLAAAPEDEVLKLWQGLGYYSRARNLRAAAREVVERFGGVFPRSLDAAHPGRYNQAIMDFGAIQCTPASPRCEACPLSESCLALAAGTVADRPVKRGKTRVRDRWFNYLHVASGDRVLLHRREGRDIWQGLYEFPLIETDAPVEFPDLAALPQFRRLLGDGPWHLVRSVSLPRHQLSHQRLHAVVHRIETPAFTPAAAAMAVPADSLGDYAVPRLVDRYLMQAGSDDSSF